MDTSTKTSSTLNLDKSSRPRLEKRSKSLYDERDPASGNSRSRNGHNHRSNGAKTKHVRMRNRSNSNCEHDSSSPEPDDELADGHQRRARSPPKSLDLQRSQNMHNQKGAKFTEKATLSKPRRSSQKKKVVLDGHVSDICPGSISDDCCSEFSTTSTVRSYLVEGLHSCCMPPPPDYDFMPNLQRARMETLKRKSPSIDGSASICSSSCSATSRRLAYDQSVRDKKKRNSFSSQSKLQQRQKSAITKKSNEKFDEPTWISSTDLINLKSEKPAASNPSAIPRYVSQSDFAKDGLTGEREKEMTNGVGTGVLGCTSAGGGGGLDSEDESNVSTPIGSVYNRKVSSGGVGGPMLLDEATWTKIEELVKQDNRDVQLQRKRNWAVGFLAGMVTAVVISLCPRPEELWKLFDESPDV